LERVFGSQENLSPKTVAKLHNMTIESVSEENPSCRVGPKLKLNNEHLSDRFIPFRQETDSEVEQCFLVEEAKAHQEKLKETREKESDEQKDLQERRRKYVE
jgi:hypothetical protein